MDFIHVETQKAELKKGKGNPLDSHDMLPMYREVFQSLTTEFRTYQSLLASIKGIYEMELDRLESRVQELLPFEERSRTMKKSFELQLEALSTAHQQESDRLRKLLLASEEETERLYLALSGSESLLEEKESEIFDLRKETADLAETCDRLQRAFHRQDEEKVMKGMKNAENEEKLYLSAKRLREVSDDLTRALSEIQVKDRLMKTMESREVFDSLKERSEQLEQQLAAFKVSYTGLMDQHNKLALLNDENTARIEELTAERDYLRSHFILRPQWKVLDDLLPDFDSDGQSDDIVWSRLVAAVETMADQVAEFMPRVGSASSRDRIAGNFNEAYFIGLGESDSVPQYLRHVGRIRNRRMPKREAETLIRDIWDVKVTAGVSLQDAVFIFLHKKFGIQHMVCETSYNFLAALKRFRFDPDCSAFLNMLEGDMEEEVYADQLEEVHRVEDVFKRVDRTENNGKVTGTVRKRGLMSELAKYFESKTEENFKFLRDILNNGAPGTSISYMELFREDRDGNQSDFLEAIRDQLVEERNEYVADIQRELLTILNPSGDVENIEDSALDIVTLERLKDAITKVDPEKPSGDLEKCLSRVFPPEAPPELPLNTVMKTLRRGVLRRFRRGKNQTGSPSIRK